MDRTKNCPPGNNDEFKVLTIDGVPFEFHRLAPSDELAASLRKMQFMANAQQIKAFWGLAETIDENGNPHYAVIRYGVANDADGFLDRLERLTDEYGFAKSVSQPLTASPPQAVTPGLDREALGGPFLAGHSGCEEGPHVKLIYETIAEATRAHDALAAFLRTHPPSDPAAPTEPCDCKIGDCKRITRRCLEDQS